MSPHIRAIQTADAAMWDAYVHSHPQATLYHLYGWRNVIEKTYGHKTYYLAAIRQTSSQEFRPPPKNGGFDQPLAISHQPLALVGLLPLVHLKHFLFGNSLISMPFFDLGGILADEEETERSLLLHAIKLGQTLKATTIELRHSQPLSCLDSPNSINSSNSTNTIPIVTKSHKVRMLLDLPDSPDELMNSFKAKLRSQIKKPMKEGLAVKIGGAELLKDFYRVFARNMRDLGSPVHSNKLMMHVLCEFPNDARIVIVYGGNHPLASSLIIAFNGMLENPWSSSLREFSHLSPNMLLYWRMLEYAYNNGLTCFDFGRSTPNQGTYRFKEQWGARPSPLYWHYILLNGHQLGEAPDDKSRFESLINYWQKLPVSVSRLIGPLIRKHIGL
jgi:FemAB-related protein (PEP-CTERM system-associated)